MEPTSIAWQENQRRSFCSETSMIVSFESDTISPMIGTDSIVSLSYTKSGDILSGSLTQDKLTLKIKAKGNELQWLKRVDADTMRNAKITFRPSFMLPQGEGRSSFISIRGGTYYITDFVKSADERSATIQAESILAFMTPLIETNHQNTADTVFNSLIRLANRESAVPSERDSLVPVMDTEVMQETTVQILPEDKLTIAQGLQLIANACQCVLYVDRGGSRIHCERFKTDSENYVLSEKIMYQQLETKYSDLVGNITVVTDHGTKEYGTNNEGEKIGARQIITNPLVLTNDIPPAAWMQHTFQTLHYGRKKFTANVRLDPALDLFDPITIPNGDTADIAVVTKINATYNGAWKASIEATAINGTARKLRICDLEMMTLAQIEKLKIKEVAPEGE